MISWLHQTRSNAQPLEPQWCRGGGVSGSVIAFSPMPNPCDGLGCVS